MTTPLARPRIRLLLVAIAIFALIFAAAFVYWPRYQAWRRNAPIYRQLDRTLALNYPKGIPLGGLIKTIRTSTVGPETPNGIPVYIEPTALDQPGVSMGSTVTIDASGMPLKDGLDRALAPLGLDYAVEDGLLKIGRVRRKSP